jgi:dipeptidyl aminopeptidase/acylaminoacyl peptidase
MTVSSPHRERCVTRKDEPVPQVSAAMVAAGRPLGEPRLSPDGQRLAFVSNGLVVVDAAGGPEVTVTTDPSPSGARSLGGGVFDWAPGSDALAYTARAGGIWWQPVAGGPARCVVEAPDAWAPAVSCHGQVAYQREHRTIEVDGRPLSGDTDFVNDPSWSPDGTTVAWQEWDVPAMPWDSSRIVVAPADGSGPPELVAGGHGVQVQQPRFSPDGRSLAYLCDAGGWLNLTVLHLASGVTTVLDETFEHGGPTWGPGQRSYAWQPDGSLVVARNEHGFGALLRWRPGDDPEPLARAVHGGISAAGERIAAVRTGGRTPTQIVLHEAGQRRTVALGPVAFGDAPVPEPELVSWPSEDWEIPARLYRPDGVERPPLLCWIHGGPTDQWQVEWRGRFSFWLDRGWAILVPDHRGSTGHGRAFAQALAGAWGEADVADVVAGIEAAIERGWCDPTRVVVMGASAGGFTALNVLASRPGLCRAGVDLYGVADLEALAAVDHRYEAHYTHSLVGPLPERVDVYRARSPSLRATAITEPVLILQGTDDVVVPVAQSEALAAALPRAELHLYDGEGHGWGRPEVVIDELERTEAFLRVQVGGVDD